MELSSNWQGAFGDLDDALKIVNDLYWNITFREKNERWQLFTRDQLIGTFESRLEMDSFILGMSLALGVLPPEIIDQIKKFIE